MKITIVMGFFLPVPPLAGGATEKIWFRFAQLFAQAGHEVTLISRRWPGLANCELADGITHLRLRGRTHTRSLPINLLLDFLWSVKVLFALPRGDIVVSNNVSLPIFAGKLRPSAGRVAVVLGRMPKGQTRFYGLVDRLLPTSNAVFEKVLAENPRVAARCRISLNPVDWGFHAKANVKPRTGAPLTIGYVGRINPEKGLENLVDAAALLYARGDLPPWRLVIIGPHSVAAGGGGDDYLRSLVTRAQAALPAAQFEFTGPIFNAVELGRRYGEIDVFCYPTLAEQGEGLSVAPIEAMAAGAVPVVSNLSCYRDLIVAGENGLVFDHRAPNATAQLADQLASLLSDAPRRRQLAARAQADAHRFDYAETARRLLEDFQSLTDRPRR